MDLTVRVPSQHISQILCATVYPNVNQRLAACNGAVLTLVKCCVVTAAAAGQSEPCRSFSLPDNRLVTNSRQLQPSSPLSSASLIASVEKKGVRTSIDSTAVPQCTVDRTSTPADVKSGVCDVIVTSPNVQSPIRNVRPTRLDLAAVQASKADSSPDDRKQLVGILLNRSPRRANSVLGNLGFVAVLRVHIFLFVI